MIDPVDLEKQHLSQLLEAMRRCVFFSDNLLSSIPWPLSGGILEDNCRDLELFNKLAAFNERFSKLQDITASVMRHSAQLSGEKCGTFLEVLAFFEKIGVLTSIKDWQRMRAIRNMAAHDYSINYEEIALHFNAIQSVINKLFRVAVNLNSYCRNNLQIVSQNGCFDGEWVDICQRYCPPETS